MNIVLPHRDEIEQILGRRLHEQDRSTVVDLNAFPPDLLEQARKLSPSLSLQFLEFYLHDEAAEYIQWFFEDVVEDGVDPALWRRGGVLSVYPPLDVMLGQEIPIILGYLGPKPGETWQRFRPTWDDWRIREISAGAPALIRPELDYRYEPPANVRRYAPHPFIDRLEPVEDITVAARRWIALHFAREAVALELLGKVWEVKTLCAAVAPEVAALSNDATLALSALLLEIRKMGVIGLEWPEQEGALDDKLPGQRGPDAWYAGNLVTD